MIEGLEMVLEDRHGAIDTAFPGMGSIDPHGASNKVRILAVLGVTRFARLQTCPRSPTHG